VEQFIVIKAESGVLREEYRKIEQILRWSEVKFNWKADIKGTESRRNL